jgi:hypothetical protein
LSDSSVIVTKRSNKIAEVNFDNSDKLPGTE